jgi:hypothetical protein
MQLGLLVFAFWKRGIASVFLNVAIVCMHGWCNLGNMNYGNTRKNLENIAL